MIHQVQWWVEEGVWSGNRKRCGSRRGLSIDLKTCIVDGKLERKLAGGHLGQNPVCVLRLLAPRAGMITGGNEYH